MSVTQLAGEKQNRRNDVKELVSAPLENVIKIRRRYRKPADVGPIKKLAI